MNGRPGPLPPLAPSVLEASVGPAAVREPAGAPGHDAGGGRLTVARPGTASSSTLWLHAMVLGLAIRIPVSMALGHPYDFEIWRSYAKLVWAFHVNALFWWSQGPLGLLALILSQSFRVVAEGFGWEVPPAFENLSLHLPFLAGDLLLSYALWSLARRHAPDWQRRVLVTWALLPGLWWIPAGHGQFDPWIPATVLMAAAAVTDDRWGAAGRWLGLGFGFKYLPALLLPGFLMLSWKRTRLRGASRLAGGFLLAVILSLAPLVLTASRLGLHGGASLLWDRINWWSVGTESVLSASALAGAVSSPYPVLLGILRSVGLAWALSSLPLLLVGTGSLATLGWYGFALRRGPVVEVPSNRTLCQLLSYACLTLLLVGGLSQVAVIQRLYWAAPLLLALATVRDSRLTFGVALMYSYLLLLPEWFSTSPLLYLRPPLSDTGLRLASELMPVTGWGGSHAPAVLIGSLVVPVGVAGVLWTGVPPSGGRIAMAVLGLLGAALMGLLVLRPEPATITTLGPLAGLAVSAGTAKPRSAWVLVALLAVVVLVGLALVLAGPWATSLSLHAAGAG